LFSPAEIIRNGILDVADGRKTIGQSFVDSLSAVNVRPISVTLSIDDIPPAIRRAQKNPRYTSIIYDSLFLPCVDPRGGILYRIRSNTKGVF
jgi:hypothetical protein